jgi:hypothetical protein
MPRAEAFNSGPSSPVTKYLQWSSAERKFHYYDKNAGKEVYLDLPLKFIYLDSKATIKGFSPVSQSSIYSNDVSNTKNEILIVRSFKANMPIAQGFYKEIKAKVEEAGGKYHASIYAFSDTLGVINIAIKGDALKEWSNFATANRKSFLGSFIEVASVDERKNGAVKYAVPVFTSGGAIPLAASEESDKKYDELMAYFKSRSASTEVPSNVIEAEAIEVPQAATTQVDEFDGLPF